MEIGMNEIISAIIGAILGGVACYFLKDKLQAGLSFPVILMLVVLLLFSILLVVKLDKDLRQNSKTYVNTGL